MTEHQRQGASDGAVTRVLRSAGLASDRVARYEPLSGGTYNTLYRVHLTDGGRLVLKIPPPLSAPALTYERELLRAEATYYRTAAAAGVPVPRVEAAEFDPAAAAGRYLLMSDCPGITWHEAAERMDPAERTRLRTGLGGLVARLHTLTGPGFGYPAGSVAPLADSWRAAFTAMLDAVLDDAERYGARLPLPVDRVRESVAAVAPVLDEVTVPVPVHFDLWQGNVLVHPAAGAPGTLRVSGLIDGERMFWGDPLADLVSPALFGSIEDDPAFLVGYAAHGGRDGLDDAARLRLALYRCYLYLIMLVEAVPRAYGPERLAWARTHVVPHLQAALSHVTTGRPGTAPS